MKYFIIILIPMNIKGITQPKMTTKREYHLMSFYQTYNINIDIKLLKLMFLVKILEFINNVKYRINFSSC